MTSVSKSTDLQKKKIKTPEKIRLLTPLLTYLIENNLNNLLSIRTKATKKTRTIKEVLNVIRGKNKIVGTISPQQV